MANIKNITKKLIDAGYSEGKLILMTEKEIRETYKNYKSSPKEDDSILSSPNTTPENNDNTTSVVKEETTMKNEMIKEMKKLARKYDAFTHCIEDCRQKEEAEKRNKTLGVKFVEVANKMGINATVNDLYEIISNDYDSFDEAIEAYIKSHEVRVVSATLTQENGELTFVELSPEQKLEISKVLDAQLQDANYSSWFEEENGIFKLYTAWVDEDPTVEEEYYFDDNKLIKVEVEKEETTMKTRTTQELINDALNISKIQDENYVTNAMLREEYKKLTGNVIGSKKTRPVIIKAIQDELHKEPSKTAPDDAKVLTYRLMHKIGDHALSNREKGFGTTVSAWMLCAYILEVKYDIKKLKGHEHEITDEMKETVKNVRKWLIDNHYIETVTFKDEKGFVFYTPEYDGNRQSSMYDATKFQSTGKTETTTYRVTKEMNKWYTK